MLDTPWGCRISMVISLEHLLYFRIFEEVLLFVVGPMASKLLRGVGALASQALRAHGPNGVTMVFLLMMSRCLDWRGRS